MEERVTDLPLQDPRHFDCNREIAARPAVPGSAEKLSWRTSPFAPPIGGLEGVPMLRTGLPIGVSVVDETLDRVRREQQRVILRRIRPVSGRENNRQCVWGVPVRRSRTVTHHLNAMPADASRDDHQKRAARRSERRW
jgi:hypothetical protein